MFFFKGKRFFIHHSGIILITIFSFSCVDNAVETCNSNGPDIELTFQLPDGSLLTQYYIQTSIPGVSASVPGDPCLIDFGCDGKQFLDPTCVTPPEYPGVYFACFPNGVLVKLFSVQHEFHISVKSLDNQWYYEGDITHAAPDCPILTMSRR